LTSNNRILQSNTLLSLAVITLNKLKNNLGIFEKDIYTLEGAGLAPKSPPPICAYDYNTW